MAEKPQDGSAIDSEPKSPPERARTQRKGLPDERRNRPGLDAALRELLELLRQKLIAARRAHDEELQEQLCLRIEHVVNLQSNLRRRSHAEFQEARAREMAKTATKFSWNHRG